MNRNISYSVSPNIAILGAKRLFARLGALPFLLLAAMIIFCIAVGQFFHYTQSDKCSAAVGLFDDGFHGADVCATDWRV